jgi:hypothetical protein
VALVVFRCMAVVVVEAGVTSQTQAVRLRLVGRGELEITQLLELTERLPAGEAVQHALGQLAALALAANFVFGGSSDESTCH